MTTAIQCDCSRDDFDPPSCYRQQLRRARKQHTCCECGSAIAVGERHEVASGVWDGTPGRFRTCLVCTRIRDDRCPHGYLHGGLRETLWECIGLDYVSGEIATHGFWGEP